MLGRRVPARRGERGAATAELAMVIPMLVALTVGLVWLLAVGMAQIRTVDAARETARALTRGDSQADAVARGREVGPPGTALAVSSGGGEVRVRSRATLDGPGGLFGWLPGATVRAEAVAAAEDSSGGFAGSS